MKSLYPILIGLIILNSYSNGGYVNRVSTSYQTTEMPMQSNIQIPFEWKRLESMSNGQLVPTNGIPIDVQPHYFNKTGLRTFVTLPRFTASPRFTLATVTQENGTFGPVLKPYPNYEAHNNGDDCDGMTAVFRVAITECNQMWVMDAGVIGPNARCPPQLLLFDLDTDQLIHRFRFNTSLYIPSASTFVTPVVDVRDPPPRGSCRNAMIYIADVNFHGLVVYDYMNNNAWRVENKFMYPDPQFGTHTIAGENFELMDGIIGLATDKKNLYFHPMASKTEYAVPLSIIDNSTNFAGGSESMPAAFFKLGERSSECAASTMDDSGNMYCVTFNPIELISWNIDTPYGTKNFKKIPLSSENLQFVSGMKVVRNHQGNEELWMCSNRYQKLAAGTLNFDEVNFRILVHSLNGASETDNDLQNKLVFSN